MTILRKATNTAQIKIGDKFNTNCHGMIEVISYNHANDIGVRFDNGYERSATSGNIQKGKVKDPTSPVKTHAKRADADAIIMGKVYTNNEGYKFYPTKYFNASKIEVTFESGYVMYARAQNINSGGLRDMLSPSKFSCGVIGVGEYSPTENPKEFTHWSSVIARTNDLEYKKRFPTYASATMCEGWLNFQTFAAWCNTQLNFSRDDFVLDKDILVKGNKHYSPQTCMFLPYKINGLFTKANSKRGTYPIGVYFATSRQQIAACLRENGKNVHLGYFTNEVDAFNAYKTAKEKYIQVMANRFKDVITEKCYNALYAYEVEITD